MSKSKLTHTNTVKQQKALHRLAEARFSLAGTKSIFGITAPDWLITCKPGLWLADFCICNPSKHINHSNCRRESLSKCCPVLRSHKSLEGLEGWEAQVENGIWEINLGGRKINCFNTIGKGRELQPSLYYLILYLSADFFLFNVYDYLLQKL